MPQIFQECRYHLPTDLANIFFDSWNVLRFPNGVVVVCDSYTALNNNA